MQTFYIYIMLLGVCAFFANTANTSFGGSNQNFNMIFTVGAGLGFLSFLVLFIASFFFATWWHVVLLFIITSSIAGLIHPFGRNPFIGLASCVGVIVFTWLAWVSMLN